MDNYEIGFKLSFGQGYLNGALFFNDIEDMQREVNLADPVSGVVQVIKNAADADILGIELDGAFNLTENLLATASAGWLGPIPLGGAYAPLAKGRVIGGEVTFTF